MIDKQFLAAVTINSGLKFRNTGGYCVWGAWAAAMGCTVTEEYWAKDHIEANKARTSAPVGFFDLLVGLEHSLMNKTVTREDVKARLIELVDRYYKEDA